MWLATLVVGGAGKAGSSPRGTETGAEEQAGAEMLVLQALPRKTRHAPQKALHWRQGAAAELPEAKGVLGAACYSWLSLRG